jgi:hypothetical protein
VAGGLLLLLLLLLLPVLALLPIPVVVLLLLLLLKFSAALLVESAVVAGCGMPAERNTLAPAASATFSRVECCSCM